ncbi:MAG: hypothetical protein ACRYFX_08600 [Janthinobacterium lividum]
MQRIHIRTVLAEIDLPGPQGQARAFSLAYFKTNGSKGQKATVRKGGLSGGAAGGSGKFGYKVKEKGTLQLINCQNEQAFAVKICLLTHYNGQRIQHG